MGCDEVTDLIDAYVDFELTGAERAMVAQHLADCPDCARLSAERDMLRARVREAGEHPLPAGLSARLQQALSQEVEAQVNGKAPVTDRRSWWLLGSHGTAAALGALALFVVMSIETRQDTISDALSAHLRSLTTEQFQSVASGQSHTVRPWFAGKVDFAPPVPDLATAGFPLLGGHVDYLAGRPAAALDYGRRLHRITLLVVPQATAPQTSEAVSERGYNIVPWRDETFAYWAISDLNRAELTEFTQRFQTSIGKPPPPP